MWRRAGGRSFAYEAPHERALAGVARPYEAAEEDVPRGLLLAEVDPFVLCY